MSVDPTPWKPDTSNRPEMRVIFEMFRGLPRQGPGSDEHTLRAWSLLKNLPRRPEILNVGCGTGGDALAIARGHDVRTTCIDIDQPSLDVLARRAAEGGIPERITPINQTLTDLSRFADRSFDVLWAEGSIFIYGFAKALQNWKRLLRPRGYFVISDVVWTTDNRPREAVDFWNVGYPDLESVEERIRLIHSSGYDLIDHFSLPERCWWDVCYTPMENNLPALREKYRDDADALLEIEEAQAEINLFRKYSNAYGYEFFVMRLP